MRTNLQRIGRPAVGHGRRSRYAACAILPLILVALVSCRRSEPAVLLDPYDSAEVAARAFNFQVYPGAKFDGKQTEVFRKANFVANPESAIAPPMAVYVTDDPIDAVAEFYATRYGFDGVAPTGNAQDPTTPAFFTSGDLSSGVTRFATILEKLDLKVDFSAVSGEFRGAHISSAENMPRVSLQRPFVDFTTGAVVNRTAIVMVKE